MLPGFFPLAWTGFESDFRDTNISASPDTTEVKNKTSASCPSSPLLHQSLKNQKGIVSQKDFHKWSQDLPVYASRNKVKPKPFLMAKGSQGKFKSEETSEGHFGQPHSYLEYSLLFWKWHEKFLWKTLVAHTFHPPKLWWLEQANI